MNKIGKIIYDEYLLCYNPTHHKANKYGYVRIHIMQAEKKLGRKLKPGETVHHIDKNKHNNLLDNLIVFRTLADHTAFHKGTRAVKCDDGIWECPDKNQKEKLCPICNKNMMDRHSNMCLECYKNKRNNDFLNKIPSRNILKYEIYNYSFEELGKKYGVTGNAVKKWCKKYNLPFIKSEINLIPKDEWESEILSETTQNKIILYYEERKANDEYIIDYYNSCHNLSNTSKKFHKDINTIKDILIKNNIKILSYSKSRNYVNLFLYKDNKEIGVFHTLKELSSWFISNGYTSMKNKSLCDKITKHIKNNTLIFGFKVVKA